jgi:hypothetical protein
MRLKFLALIIMLALCICQQNEATLNESHDGRFHQNFCEKIHSKSRCLNNGLCTWTSDKKFGNGCELRLCAGRSNDECDFSVCRTNLEKGCLRCSSLLNLADCASNSCCWYDNQCHNLQSTECDLYNSEYDCQNNALEGTCYWNDLDNQCYTYAYQCSDYASYDECKKGTSTGYPCYWDSGANKCDDSLAVTCSAYNLYDCGNYTQADGTECYWYDPKNDPNNYSGGQSLGCYPQQTLCSDYNNGPSNADPIGCQLGTPTGICYLTQPTTGIYTCTNTRLNSGQCSQYVSKNFCTFTSNNAPCYWYNAACNDAAPSCSLITNIDYSADPPVDDCNGSIDATGYPCRVLDSPTGPVCGSDFQPVSFECSDFEVHHCNDYQDHYGNQCYWFLNQCNAARLNTCTGYYTEEDCAVGTLTSPCYWYAEGCHNYKAISCLQYSMASECDLGTKLGDICYFYNEKCHAIQPSCFVYNTESQCLKGTVGGGPCYWYKELNRCFGTVQPQCSNHP